MVKELSLNKVSRIIADRTIQQRGYQIPTVDSMLVSLPHAMGGTKLGAERHDVLILPNRQALRTCLRDISRIS